MIIASFGAFLAFLDATIVNVCFPAIAETFPDTSTGALSWVLNAYNLVFAAALVAGGRLADLIGRRRVFVVGVVLFTVASVLCAVAGSVGVLIGWRIVQAVGAACWCRPRSAWSSKRPGRSDVPMPSVCGARPRLSRPGSARRSVGRSSSCRAGDWRSW